MYRTAILAIISMLLLVGCSKEYTIKVVNNTAGDCVARIDDTERVLEPGDVLKKNRSETQIFGGGDKKYTVFYSGDHRLSEYTKTSDLGDDTYHIHADCGAIGFFNTSQVQITEVYIRDASASEWGDNLLEAPIAAGDSGIWSCAVGYYSLKAIDENANVWIPANTLGIGLDTTLNLAYRGR